MLFPIDSRISRGHIRNGTGNKQAWVACVCPSLGFARTSAAKLYLQGRFLLRPSHHLSLQR